MARGKSRINFILDETGSMSGYLESVINAFNEYVETLKTGKDAKSTLFTLTKFNSENTSVSPEMKINDVPVLTRSSYIPRAITPLYDAIGKTIHAIDAAKKGKNDSVLVVIQTDGQENASNEYTQRDIFDLIEEKKLAGWTFVFLGADQDAFLAGSTLGIPMGNIHSYASGQTRSTMNLVATHTLNYMDNVSRGITQTDSFFSQTSETDDTP